MDTNRHTKLRIAATLAAITVGLVGTGVLTVETAGASNSITLECGPPGFARIHNTRTAAQWPHPVHVWIVGQGVVPLGPLDTHDTPLGGRVEIRWGDPADVRVLTAQDCTAPTTTTPVPTTTAATPTTTPAPTTTTTPSTTAVPTVVLDSATGIDLPATTTTAPAPAGPELPATGINAGWLAIAASILIVAGVIAVIWSGR